MSILKEAPADPTQLENEDDAAIAKLRKSFETQQTAFAANRNPSLADWHDDGQPDADQRSTEQ